MKNKHDTFVKKVMSDISIAKEYFLRVLPKPLLEMINIESMCLSKDSFLDRKMVAHYADLVFKCKSAVNNSSFNICFIFEHKSIIKKELALQLLQYINGILSKHKNSQVSEVPIAVVFNHGPTNGIKPSIGDVLGTKGSYLDRYIPSFDYILDDITKLSDDEIYSINHGFLASFLLMLKHYKDKHWIKSNPYLILNRIDIDDRNLIQEFLVYFFNLAPFEEDESFEIINNIDHQKNTDYMGVIDTLLEKRENKGRLEGMQAMKTDVIKNMYDQNFDPEFIQSIVSMPLQDVISIIKDYEKSKCK